MTKRKILVCLMAALLIVGLLPANALANTSGGDSARKINAYFKTVLVGEDGDELEQRINDGPVRYNNTGGFWANLGSFETTLETPDGGDALHTAIKEFKTALEGNTLSINPDDRQNLAFVPNVKWTELKQVDGEAEWHLDGQVTFCKVTYKAGEVSGDEVVQYYVKGDKSVTAASAATFTAPHSKKFAGWKLNDETSYQPGDALVDEENGIERSITLTAQWEDATSVYVYFKTVDTEGKNVEVEGVSYNSDGQDETYWATLGTLQLPENTRLFVFKNGGSGSEEADEAFKEVTAKVKDGADSSFVRHTSNPDVPLELITWDELKKEDQGAVDFSASGTAWHLDGIVTGYKIIYDANGGKFTKGDGDEETLNGSKYYLSGSTTNEITNSVPDRNGYTFAGWSLTQTDRRQVEKVTFQDKDVTLYAIWKTDSDLVDDSITIRHQINQDEDWHQDDAVAHEVTNTNVTVAYEATLDMEDLKFAKEFKEAEAVAVSLEEPAQSLNQSNSRYADLIPSTYESGKKPDTENNSLWDYMQDLGTTNSLALFTGSKVNLYVKFDENLAASSDEMSEVKVTSQWFQRAKDKTIGKNESGYWVIPCKIRTVKDTDAGIAENLITLSGITLTLTDDAKRELSNDKQLSITSEGYIDGRICVGIPETDSQVSALSLAANGPQKEQEKMAPGALYLVGCIDEHAANTARLTLKESGGYTPSYPTYTTYTVQKVWNDEDAANRPDSVQVQLYRNGAAHSVLTLSAANNWMQTCTLADGYTYTVSELAVPAGYTDATARNGNTFIITNTAIVDEPDDPADPTEPTKPEEPKPQDRDDHSAVPKTGDGNATLFWLILGGASLTGLYALRRKKSHSA